MRTRNKATSNSGSAAHDKSVRSTTIELPNKDVIVRSSTHTYIYFVKA